MASANQELEYRSVIAGSRQSYLGVLAGISQILANKQSIISQESALKATEAGYIVGTRTIVDVLNAQSDLYSAQKDYTKAEYEYLLDTLTLKEEAGTLSANDLAQINSWLSKPVSLAVYEKVTKNSSFAPEHTIQYHETVPKSSSEVDLKEVSEAKKTKKIKTTKKSTEKRANTAYTVSKNIPQLPAPTLPNPFHKRN